jgi:hypothetical protein
MRTPVLAATLLLTGTFGAQTTPRVFGAVRSIAELSWLAQLLGAERTR